MPTVATGDLGRTFLPGESALRGHSLPVRSSEESPTSAAVLLLLLTWEAGSPLPPLGGTDGLPRRDAQDRACKDGKRDRGAPLPACLPAFHPALLFPLPFRSLTAQPVLPGAEIEVQAVPAGLPVAGARGAFPCSSPLHRADGGAPGEQPAQRLLQPAGVGGGLARGRLLAAGAALGPRLPARALLLRWRLKRRGWGRRRRRGGGGLVGWGLERGCPPPPSASLRPDHFP